MESLYNYYKKIRLSLLLSLIFYCLLTGCTEKKDKPVVFIEWELEKAIGMVVPLELLGNVPQDSIAQLLHIHLAGSKESIAILGHYDKREQVIIFRPVLAFTRGLTYEVRLRDQLLQQLTIPAPASHVPQTVVSVFPRLDTLPSNVLKFYIQFSGPMQEGQALEHILLIKNGRDTVRSAFLDLQPELWNTDGSQLTLWFDPGRIKRDLQPNKVLGPPLLDGQQYTLVIDRGWRDSYGDSLAQPYEFAFVTAGRDETSPDPASWKLDIPRIDSRDALTIHFPEPLDYMLARNSIRIFSETGTEIKGESSLDERQTTFRFLPANGWRKGKYDIEIESRLEDLAGNNLNHLFDTDLTVNKAEGKEIFRKRFEIR